MATMRVRDRVAVSVVDPDSGLRVTLTAGDPYDAKHPIVKAYGWAFESDTDRDRRPVEEATANPGEARTTRRP